MRDCKLVTLLLIVVSTAAIFFAGCGKDKAVETNNLPTGTLTVARDSVDPGEVDTVTANYTDADGDSLTYSWTSQSGRLFDTTNVTVVWNAPDRRGSYWIAVRIFDGTDSLTDTTRVKVGSYEEPSTNHYVTVGVCDNCHIENDPSIVAGWRETGHADAFNSLYSVGQGTNDACLECHTTGWDTSVDNGGYDEYRFTDLEAVQCETCHKLGFLHQVTAATADTSQSCINSVCHTDRRIGFNPDQSRWTGGDTALTRLMPHPDSWLDSAMTMTIASSPCSTCHNDEHYSHYAQWDSTGHSDVTISSVGDPNSGCGPTCHTAWGYLDDLHESSQTPDQYPLRPFEYPDSLDPVSVPISCLACHDPHYNKYDGQLREPVGFLCASCHNAEQQDAVGDTVVHVSGNMLAGEGGYEYAGYTYTTSAHTSQTRYTKCSACHVSKEASTSTYGYSNNTPHTFGASLTNCGTCHVGITSFNLNSVQDSVQTLLDSLGTIVTTYADSAGTTNYDQAKFNYDFVKYDGSKGVHNPDYTFQLLNTTLESYPE